MNQVTDIENILQFIALTDDSCTIWIIQKLDPARSANQCILKLWILPQGFNIHIIN